MSLRLRIVLVLSGLTTLIIVISGGVIHQFTEKDLNESLDEKLNNQVDLVSETGNIAGILERQRFFQSPSFSPNAINSTDSQSGQLNSLNRLIDVQIPTSIKINDQILITTEGYPTFTSPPNNSGFDNAEFDDEKWRVLSKTFTVVDLYSLREIERAIRNAIFTGRISIPQAREKLVSLNTSPPQYIVSIQTTVSRNSLNTTMQDFRKRFLIVGFFSIMTSAIAGWFLGGLLIKPLSRLGSETNQLRNTNDLSSRVQKGSGPPEVEKLADEINNMISRIQKSNDITEQSLEHSRSFASNVGHELRTPLTSIKMNLELLEKHENIELEERRIILKDVLNKHNELLQTFESLKFLAMGDLSQQEAYEEIDLLNLIHSAISDPSLQPEISIKIDAPEPPPLVIGWREGLLLLFRNLIDNSKTHGKVPNQNLNIHLTVSVSKNWLTVTVEDDGKGISEVDIENVTDRFVKGKNSPGSGLGLSLVKQQAESHGGK
ncbi:HAMP domain-containing histidine kinase, partial [Dehalococcoidia bacterium]|nr:HAMP domain-containing histidine kinase [Dehalococcoidia bacterium]